MKHFIWVSFDLGVKGDYQGMYAWLDSKGAKECGESLACFWYEHVSGDLLDDLKKDLEASVELDENKSRVYVVRLLKGKMKGSFIFGRRRNPPWAGGPGGPPNPAFSLITKPWVPHPLPLLQRVGFHTVRRTRF